MCIRDRMCSDSNILCLVGQVVPDLVVELLTLRYQLYFL
jgi:hypothetical protein